jgi:hypothetical protein
MNPSWRDLREITSIIYSLNPSTEDWISRTEIRALAPVEVDEVRRASSPPKTGGSE